MPIATFRVTVKGRFADLDEPARTRLLAELPRHEILVAGGYGEAGSLTYDRALDFFRFRVELTVDAEDPEADAVEQAEQMAGLELDRLEVGRRDLRVTTTDMASMWRPSGKPSRRS